MLPRPRISEPLAEVDPAAEPPPPSDPPQPNEPMAASPDGLRCRHDPPATAPPAPASPAAVPLGFTLGISSRIPPEVVQRPVRERFHCFRRCYERGLRKNAALAGRVSVHFVIEAATGAVINARDGRSDLPDREVVACVVDEFTLMRFPAPERGDVTVTYPIEFRP